MKLKIRFSYTESVIGRCRKARRVHRDDGTVNLTIKEVTSAQAPVAIRSTQTPRTGKCPITVEYRWFARKLWTAVLVHQGRVSAHTSRKNDWHHPAIAADIDLTTDSMLGGNFDIGVRYLTSDEKSAVIASIRKSLAENLIIDGVFYRPAGEPRYVVMTFGLGQNHGGTSLSVSDSFNTNIAKSRYFSLLEYDRAVALATQVASGRGDTKSLPITVDEPSFEVVLPEAIRLKPSRQHGDGCPLLNQFEALAQASGGSLAVGLAFAMAACS